MTHDAAGRVVILTTFDTDTLVMGAIEVSVSSLLLISAPLQKLIAVICIAHDGNSITFPGLTRRLPTTAHTGHVSGIRTRGEVGRHASEDSVEALQTAEASQQVAGLTQHGHGILVLTTLDLNDQEICDRKWLSIPTAIAHVSHLLSATGCRDRIQLMLLALRGGIVDPADILHLN